MEKTMFVYEGKHKDFELTEQEEKIMGAMRKVNELWKAYKKKPGGNNLILFCGGTGCSMRYESPSSKNIIDTFDDITCDGGDGGDKF